MSASNVYATNPIEEVNSTKLNNNEGKEDLGVKPMLQKNSQEDVRTLLNPVLVENKEDNNEFAKFDEEDKLSEGNNNNENVDLLQKERPVKMNSSSSLNTLENANQEQIVAIEKEVDSNKNESSGDDANSPSPNDDSSPTEDDQPSSINNVDFQKNPIKTVRRSLTDANITTLKQNINFTSSSNIRNINGRDVIVDRKYRNINCGNEEKEKKESKSITALFGHPCFNGSMELFLNKHKSKQNASAKIETENSNFINISRKGLDHVIFTADDYLETRRIDVSYNCFQELPHNIGNFDRLVELNVSNNKLKTVPIEIGYLKSLNVLNLNDNEIESLPFQIGGLKNLKFLYISDNKLQTFPREIGMLTNLEGLYASNNKISKLPVEFVRLQKLKVLDFCNNKLFCFKFKLSFMKDLEKLYLSNNQFPTFPNELTQMNNLCELYMDNNRISIIPDEINQMKRLKILRLNNNKIQKIPETLCDHKKLRILRLQNNLIKTIPKRINHMKNLRELNIDHNMIVDVPDSIALLPRLRKISYEGNYFPPEEMEERVFAISTLETANQEAVQRYCYRPVRQSFVAKAIDNIQIQYANLPPKVEKSEPEPLQHDNKSLSGPLDTIVEELAASIPVMVPEQVNNASSINDKASLDSKVKATGNSLEDVIASIAEETKSSEQVKTESNSNDNTKTDPVTHDTVPDKTESITKPESVSSKNINSTDNGGATLVNGSDEKSQDVIKSQESLKLKLIDVVLPEDITSSQSNFIFTYEESLRGSLANLDEVRRSQNLVPEKNTETPASDKNNNDLLEKKIFKKKYEHVPSKLAEKPMEVDNDEEDFVIERIPLKKGDDEDEEDTKVNKFSHLAMGSTELLHEKLKH